MDARIFEPLDTHASDELDNGGNRSLDPTGVDRLASRHADSLEEGLSALSLAEPNILIEACGPYMSGEWSWVDYLGHKGAMIEKILEAIEGRRPGRLHVLDAFCGTAAVSSALRHRGHRVHANDHLHLCTAWATASLLTPTRPRFLGLDRLSIERRTTTYADVVHMLNQLEPVEGFVTQHFSPLSRDTDGIERRYFTVSNASKIDAIRREIGLWVNYLTVGEQALLLSTLIAAVMEVSNTAGTFGCYLKTWKTKAKQPLILRPLRMPGGSNRGHFVTCKDAIEVVAESSADVIYADPPYTKRQYAAYYHVLETIVQNDEPDLEGSTGLRKWHSQSSNWCHRKRAPEELERLVIKSSSPRLVLSYNDDGQIRHQEILEILGVHGHVAVADFQMRRYRSSNLPHKGSAVTERLYTLDRQ